MDYDKLGFKSGLEVHQQLDTDKLFCNCPSLLRNDEPLFEIKRKLHAIAGESGEIDEAVKHEAGLDKEFIYQGYDTTCLIELDEAPPKMINQDALKIALQVSLLLNCDILPATQIMRKTVIDGSNTSGFQRTVLIAQNGYLDTSYGRVGVDTIALEEDAARIVKKTEKNAVYRLDRLGIPLIEIATSPDMKNPLQVKDVALKIGEILRSCNVKRGIGTIRQDVNVSIKNHKRVEIKGFQDVKMFVPVIEKEVERQIKDKENLSEVRNALADGNTKFLRPMPGSARMYPETDLPLLKISKNLIDEVKNNLPKLRSEIKQELSKKGLSEEMMKILLNSNKLDEFKELIDIGKDANLIVKMILLWPKDFAKKLGLDIKEIENRLNLDILEDILNKINKNQIEKSSLQEILFDIAKGKSLKEIFDNKIDENDVEEFVIKIIKEKPGLRDNAYMGLVMKEFKGKVSGSVAMKLIKKYIP